MKTPFAAVASDMPRVSIANLAGRNSAKTAMIFKTRGAVCPGADGEAVGTRESPRERALPEVLRRVLKKDFLKGRPGGV